MSAEAFRPDPGVETERNAWRAAPIAGLRGDPEIVEVAVRSRAGVVVMHMQGRPETITDEMYQTYLSVTARNIIIVSP